MIIRSLSFSAARCRRAAGPLAAAVALGAALVGAGPAHAARDARKAPAAMPKLVVLLVMDQFRADTPRRFEALLDKGGIRRLQAEGAVAVGRYGQQNTYTGPGHALISSGAYGYMNGVTQNKFYHRGRARSEAMMFDPDSRVLGEKEPDAEDETSPRNLIGSNLADELRLRDSKSKAVAVALKGRGALLLAGHLGSAYFFSEQTGQMTTSTYYAASLPAWAQAWNAKKPADAYFGKKWERLLGADAYPMRDDTPYETDVKGLGRTFPHPLTGKQSAPGPAFYEALLHTAAGLELQMDFARTALAAESLGQRGVTDFLMISISGTDLAGHAFGPDSQEYQDMVLRADLEIKKLLGELDRRFKPGEVLTVLTADHGAVPVPEGMAARGIEAARIKKAAIKKVINAALTERFGAGEWVLALEDPSVYLDERLARKYKADEALVQEVAGQAALTLPGMVGYFTRAQLLRGQLPPTEAARAVVRSFYPGRGGEVVLVTAPYYFWGKYGEKDQGSTHGSFYRYDTDVPVYFGGAAFVPGDYGVIDMTDVAATLAHVLRLTPPASCEGRPLMPLLRK